jgi:UDP-glucose 4-epimerase
MEGKPPVIFGDGEQTRDFTFVGDVAEANILVAESQATGIFNIGGANRVTINHLAQLIIEGVGKTGVKPVHQEPRYGDVTHSLADITKAGTFGYSPKYNLEKGLKETIATFACSNLILTNITPLS